MLAPGWPYGLNLRLIMFQPGWLQQSCRSAPYPHQSLHAPFASLASQTPFTRTAPPLHGKALACCSAAKLSLCLHPLLSVEEDWDCMKIVCKQMRLWGSEIPCFKPSSACKLLHYCSLSAKSICKPTRLCGREITLLKTSHWLETLFVPRLEQYERCFQVNGRLQGRLFHCPKIS